MKRLTFLFVFFSFLWNANAAVYLDETFNYSITNLADETSWTTTLSGVTAINGTGRTLITPPLTYSNSGGVYILSNTGKTLKSEYLNTAGATYTSVKPLGSTINTTVYLSFLYKAGSAQSQTQSTVFGLASSATSLGSTLWVGKGVTNTSNYRFGVTRSSTAGADIKWGSEEFSDVNTVFLIVLKHDFETGFTSLFVNPVIGDSEPTTPTASDNAGTARTSLTNILLRNTGSNAARFNISGVRVSSTWTEAVAAQATSPESNNSVEKFTTDFGDSSWGAPATTTPTTGAYPSSSVKGFNLVKSVLMSSSVTAPWGEKFTNRILLDKNTQGAAIEFPLLTTVGEVEIVAATGTEAMSFRLDEWTGTQWVTVGTYTTSKTLTVHTLSVLRNSETKLRIANNTGSGLYIYKILTRTYQEATELTLRTSSPAQAEVCFANLQKRITLTFNKNVEKASGTLMLNDTAIPLASCTINENVVTIPVSLENIPGTNKNYTLTVSAGTFAELGNATNLSKAISINFQTLKSVVYPTNYTALLDINYKNVNSTNTRMDVYFPTNVTTPVPVVINMHGGGWSGGYKEEQGGFTMYFNRGYAVVNVEYRLRGEALAPAAVEDVRGAMHYVLNHAQEWNIDVSKVIFQGGSAGGHLALMGGYLQNNRLYDNDCVQYSQPVKIMAVIDKYGPCDFTQLMTYSSLISWTGERFSDVNFVNSLAPVTYVNATTPPTYIIHGDADPTIPYNQSVTLYAALQNAGVKSKFTTVPNGGHGGFPAEYNTLMETEILQFLDEVLAEQITTVNNHLNTGDIKVTVSDNTVFIHSGYPIRAKVYNQLGNEVFSTGENQFIIENKGFYVIKVNNKEEKTIRKILIK